MDTPKPSQPNNPLHGIKLADILALLIDQIGWEAMAQEVKIRCFANNPTLKSSLNFLRKTPWARTEVEALYLKVVAGKYRPKRVSKRNPHQPKLPWQK